MKSLFAGWTVAVPVASALLLGAALSLPPHPALTLVCAVGLVSVVIAAVHHAEVVAHRAGSPSERSCSRSPSP